MYIAVNISPEIVGASVASLQFFADAYFAHFGDFPLGTVEDGVQPDRVVRLVACHFEGGLELGRGVSISSSELVNVLDNSNWQKTVQGTHVFVS